MSAKDDFASLFLPDLLHPVASLSLIKQEEIDDLAFLDSEQPSGPSVNGMGSYLQYGDFEGQSGQLSQSSSFSQLQQLQLLQLQQLQQQQLQQQHHHHHHLQQQHHQPQPHGNSVISNSQQPNPANHRSPNHDAQNQSRHGSILHNLNTPFQVHPLQQLYANTPMGMHSGIANGMGSNVNLHGVFPGLRYLPFMEQEFQYTGQYGDFVPGNSQQQQQLRRLMLSAQSGFSPSMSQYDAGSPWHMDDQGMLSSSLGQKRVQHPDGISPRTVEQMKQSKAGNKSGSKPSKQVKSVLTKPAKVAIQLDYQPKWLLLLLDLAPEPSTSPDTPLVDGNGNTVNIELRGFMHGRLLTNDHDNYNYLAAVNGGSPDPGRKYPAMVISVYRRNFINLHFRLFVPKSPTGLFVDGQPVQYFKLEIGALAEGKNSASALFLVGSDKEKDVKETRPGGKVPFTLIRESTDIGFADCGEEQYYLLKKFQFKSATANSTNILFQSYYKVKALLIAQLPNEARVIRQIYSSPMIVRGRNPSFYKERNDILVKPRTPGALESYEPLDSVGKGALTVDGMTPDSDISTCQTVKGEGAAAEETIPQRNDKEHGNEDDDNEDDEDNEDDNNDNGNDNENDNEDSVPSSFSNATADLKKILASISDPLRKSGLYHYFPMLSVYYLPPIDVVYFPHGAHQGNNTLRSPQPEQTPRQAEERLGKRNGSKVYFK